MPNIKFNHVFAALLGLSFLSAFVLPEKRGDAVRPHLQGLFTWVSSPVLKLSGAVSDRVEARRVEDSRSAAAIAGE